MGSRLMGSTRDCSGMTVLLGGHAGILASSGIAFSLLQYEFWWRPVESDPRKSGANKGHARRAECRRPSSSVALDSLRP
jgi:hypothetical protein